MEYVFTLKYQMPPQDCEEEPLMQRLASIGCRDARIAVGLRGRLMLSFTRIAERAEQALLGALLALSTGLALAAPAAVRPPARRHPHRAGRLQLQLPHRHLPHHLHRRLADPVDLPALTP